MSNFINVYINKKSVTKGVNRRGALLVEAALVLPLLLYLVINMIYFAFFLHDYAYLNNITRSCTRYAAVETSGNTLTKKADSITNYMNDDVANQLIIYSFAERVSTSAPQDKIKAYGYLSEGSNGAGIHSEQNPTDATADDSNMEGTDSTTKSDKFIRLELAAARTNDYPILVDALLPKVIVSSLKMKLEE